jgi:hypothetical protein
MACPGRSRLRRRPALGRVCRAALGGRRPGSRTGAGNEGGRRGRRSRHGQAVPQVQGGPAGRPAAPVRRRAAAGAPCPIRAGTGRTGVQQRGRWPTPAQSLSGSRVAACARPDGYRTLLVGQGVQPGQRGGGHALGDDPRTLGGGFHADEPTRPRPCLLNGARADRPDSPTCQDRPAQRDELDGAVRRQLGLDGIGVARG